MSAVAMPQNRSRSCRSAATDAPIIVPNSSVHHGTASAVSRETRFAHQRPPCERRRDRAVHGVRGRMAAEAREVAHEHRARAARLETGEHRLRLRVAFAGDEERARGRVGADRANVETLVQRILEPRGGEQIDQRGDCPPRSLRAPGPDDARRGSEHAVRRVARVARRLRRRKRRTAIQIELRADRRVDELPVVLAARLVQQREVDVRLQRILGGVEHRHPVQAGDLRRRVHLRGARAVLHRSVAETRRRSAC